ncbi:MAG: DUF342 domain-containing protein [Spirochaetota bacterium]
MTQSNKLIEESKQLIKTIEELSPQHTQLDVAEPAPVPGGAGAAGATRPPDAAPANDRQLEEAVNGFVELSVAEDAMQATVTLHPPKGPGLPVQVNEVYERLSRSGVVFGIDDEAIKEGVFRCNTDRVMAQNLVVAHGAEPVDELPAEIEVHPLPAAEEDAKPARDNESVDHKRRAKLPIVNRGDVIADIAPARRGMEGQNIRGEKLPFQKHPGAHKKLGENTEVEGTTVRAAVDGLLHDEKNQLFVTPVFVVTDHVDYSTGHIDFPGDVIIHGGVRDGFHVRCAGLLHCRGTLDATVVESGELVAERGIVGKGESTVRVGGSLKSRYIENCTVTAKGPVLVAAGVVGSHITTNQSVTLGKSQSVIRSVLRARDGVSAWHLGSEHGSATEIYCGIDFEIDRKLAWLRDQSVVVAEKLEQAKQLQKRHLPHGELAQIRETAHGLEDTLARLQESAADLVFHLDANEDAEVRVRDVVYPGTYIEICHRPYRVQSTMRHVRFRLDKSSGAVVAEKLDETSRQGSKQKHTEKHNDAKGE